MPQLSSRFLASFLPDQITFQPNVGFGHLQVLKTRQVTRVLLDFLQDTNIMNLEL
jgi:hypothetical protein